MMDSQEMPLNPEANASEEEKTTSVTPEQEAAPAEAPKEEVTPAETEEVPAEETPTEEPKAEEVPAETEEVPAEETPAEEPVATDEAHQYPLYTSKAEVLARVEAIAASEEAGDKQELDLLKQLFYKYHRADGQQARAAYIEAGGDPEAYTPEPSPEEEAFKTAMQTIRQRRAEEQAEQERAREENLEKKQAIIDRIKELAASPDDANKSYDEFKALQGQWREIGAVPPEKSNEVWKNYQLYVEQFYDMLKMNIELREYDFKKNLEAKTRLCELAEKLADEPDVISANNQLQGLHQEWKEIGPVAKELREELWNRFKEASTVIRKRHQEHFEQMKEKEEENLVKKTALCEQVEAIGTDDLKTFADWDGKTKEIIAIQETWRTIGYAPQKMNTKIFERFRAACDAFFEKKTAFFKTLREGLNDNLAKKTALVEKAEALQDSKEWKATTDALVELQKEWKTIGSVPKKYSEQLWKRFVGACDHFFEEKKKANADERNEQLQNLEKKQRITEQLRELAENMAECTIEKVQELQKQWMEVGHVPFREKDKAYKQYREVCDRIYKDLSQNRAARRLNSFKSNLKAKEEQGGTGLVGERNRLLRAYETLKGEIQTYENNLGFLSTSSKKGNSLVDELNKKVAKLKDELNLLAEKIHTVTEEIKKEKEGKKEE